MKMKNLAAAAAMMCIGYAAPSMAGNKGYYQGDFVDASGATVSYCFVLTHNNKFNYLNPGFSQSGTFIVSGVGITGTYVTENGNLHMVGPLSSTSSITITGPLMGGELVSGSFTVADLLANGKNPPGTVSDAGTVGSLKLVSACPV